MASSLKDDLKELLNCSICLDTLTEPKLLPCAHRFCKTCLSQEIKRSATSGQNPTFPCPLCKMTISLPKGSNLEMWDGRFQTDRLLKDVLERLEDEADDTTDVCGPHRLSLEIVCYSCNVTGCIRCAWKKHRQCTVIKKFKNEAEKIESKLRQNLQKIENFIQKLNVHVKYWTAASRSIRNQECYSNKFIEQSIHAQRERFNSVYSRLNKMYDSYTRTTLMSKQIERNIKQLVGTALGKLDIRGKCKDAERRLKENNRKIMTSDPVRKVSMQITSAPDTLHLTSIVQDISGTLALVKSEMVIKGQQLLADSNEVLSDQYQSQILENTSSLPTTFLLENLITREDQVDMGIEEEEKLLGELLHVMESAGDPKRLLADLKRLYFLSSLQMQENETSEAPQASMDLVPFHNDHRSETNTHNMVRSNSDVQRPRYNARNRKKLGLPKKSNANAEIKRRCPQMYRRASNEHWVPMKIVGVHNPSGNILWCDENIMGFTYQRYRCPRCNTDVMGIVAWRFAPEVDKGMLNLRSVVEEILKCDLEPIHYGHDEASMTRYCTRDYVEGNKLYREITLRNRPKNRWQLVNHVFCNDIVFVCYLFDYFHVGWNMKTLVCTAGQWCIAPIVHPSYRCLLHNLISFKRCKDVLLNNSQRTRNQCRHLCSHGIFCPNTLFCN